MTFGSITRQVKEEEDNETNSNHENHHATTSSHASVKKMYPCKFCNKKFSTGKALGGHQNAHRRKREAAKREKILSMTSAPKNSLPNFQSHSFGFTSPYVQLKDDSYRNSWLGQQMVNCAQPTTHGTTLMSHESNQFAYFSMQGGKSQSSEQQQQSQRSQSSTAKEIDFISKLAHNKKISYQASNSSRRPRNENIEVIDLTLRL
ncbi:zinc finger protein 1-like [Gastrolobium bilobum]|uniref:zinc finger protein 1-like n=1 Tax=Gastrolobium bilobum TaxID=150636 RepID=UPI002AB24971|nr:zinc finger protein 1-like [Gastrolobium bilobum]